MRFALLCLALMAGVFALIFLWPTGSNRPLAASSTGAAGRFSCTVTRVHDGDGPIWCAERDAAGKPIKIRLTAIAARELDNSCNPGHPCPDASGIAAQQVLAGLAQGRSLSCEATGHSYGRTTAWCWRADGIELNCAMVESKTALRWAQYDRQNRLCAQR
jgi:endonuclease YncB( thermonuclease family)